MEMKGCVVTEFDWMNPHSLIKFDYKTATGETQHWTMEIGSPPSMVLLGWSRTTLACGRRNYRIRLSGQRAACRWVARTR
jgi:hypothetical protein